jgi:hypothetical protein
MTVPYMQKETGSAKTVLKPDRRQKKINLPIHSILTKPYHILSSDNQFGGSYAMSVPQADKIKT